MHFTYTIVSAFFLGAAVLPGALAVKSHCNAGFNHNSGENCADEGWYTCSHNLKHTVSFAPLFSSSHVARLVH